MKVKTEKAFFDAASCTYIRISDVSPVVRGDTVVIFESQGGYRSWGRAFCDSHIIVDKPDYLAVVVGFSCKHAGGQGWFYYELDADGIPSRLMASQLSPERRQEVYSAWETRKDGRDWIKRPFQSVIRARPPAAAAKVKVYKAVAILGDRYVSSHDGSEYKIGKTRREKCRGNHGGFYAYATPEAAAAREARFPQSSLYPDAPRAILECEAWGKCVEYAGGKMMFTSIKPLKQVRGNPVSVK